MNRAEVELVIFDCDGVLIDSEGLVCRLVSASLVEAGYPVSTEEVIRRFAGRPEREMVAELEAEWKKPLPAGLIDSIRERTARAYQSELRAMPGVKQALGRIGLPVCVASSSYPEKLRQGLEAVGLLSRFDPHVISAQRVAHGKPAPDVFIYAAGWMRSPVANCLVVEDSVYGARAARAAGMRVLGFVGGDHCDPGQGDRLRAAGADEVFEAMDELPALIR